ncbi:MAG: hypothetical protein JWQ31_2388, partial [Mycobacterium sp.]|nr:hypothetical protein [Mycobacterium sp.]
AHTTTAHQYQPHRPSRSKTGRPAHRGHKCQRCLDETSWLPTPPHAQTAPETPDWRSTPQATPSKHHHAANADASPNTLCPSPQHPAPAGSCTPRTPAQPQATWPNRRSPPHEQRRIANSRLRQGPKPVTRVKPVCVSDYEVRMIPGPVRQPPTASVSESPAGCSAESAAGGSIPTAGRTRCANAVGHSSILRVHGSPRGFTVGGAS